MNPVVVAPLSKAKIEEYAVQVRRTLGYDDHQAVEMLKLIELQLPDALEGFWYDIVPNSELGDAEATTSMNERCIRISERCYRALSDGHLRYQFTLAHELGHLLLHTGRRVELARGAVKPYRDPEWQADCFAAAFLAPADSVRRCLSADEISARFKITKAAATVRASKLGLPFAMDKGPSMRQTP
ncbi:ImmA/IrrE family metallo-endopeptidase [Sphingomonas sp. Leaf10]|uniref:ImmA/IrrE family metallo-endopeptidase n=1 Tax=Sphingomonas sp. Leaf10 TaxID=1735676 RepID=UPI00138F8C23|nr:ImmA/IrrE family metallo-endopeptidase [Sphingomonas sp. Leaf10]